MADIPKRIWADETGRWDHEQTDDSWTKYYRHDQVEEPEGLSLLILGMKPEKLRATLVLACKRASCDRDFLQEMRNLILRIDVNEVYDDGA